MEYHWDTIRDKATEAFADPPSGQLEQDIIDAFLDDPERVIRTIDRIVKAHTKKPFNSPWAIIRKDVQQRIPTDVTASATKSRQALIDRAKAWIHNAGAHHQTWDECAAELFGTGGQTAPLAYLEQLEHDTRNSPGRPMFEGLLLASITRTKLVGREPIPDDTTAQLYTLRDDHSARDELHAAYDARHPAAAQAELDHEQWNTDQAATRQRIIERKRKAIADLEIAADENIDFTPA